MVEVGALDGGSFLSGEGQPFRAKAPLSQRMSMRTGTKQPPTTPPTIAPTSPEDGDDGGDAGGGGGDGGGDGGGADGGQGSSGQEPVNFVEDIIDTPFTVASSVLQVPSV